MPLAFHPMHPDGGVGGVVEQPLKRERDTSFLGVFISNLIRDDENAFLFCLKHYLLPLNAANI